MHRAVSVPMAVGLAVAAIVVGLIIGNVVFSSDEEGGGSSSARIDGTRVDVIVKATESSFWQSMLAGSEQASKDLGIDVGYFGPTSEADVERQSQLVDNSIARGVDAIVLASNSSTALNGAIKRARDKGIEVVIVDNPVTTPADGFIGTDNLKAGAAAGQRLCDLVRRQGKTSGVIHLESAIPGVQVLIDRDQGFRTGVRAACPPGVTVLATRYNNNHDVATATSNVNDSITRNRDLVGIFSDNDTAAAGVVRALKDHDLVGEIPAVTFDSDPQAIAGLDEGALGALVVQNPWFFGYQGVVEALMATTGSFPPAKLDPGAVVVDKSMMDDPSVKRLLTPPTKVLQ